MAGIVWRAFCLLVLIPVGPGWRAGAGEGGASTGRVWHVASGGAGDGLAPGTPFGCVGDAVAAARSGDRIVVAPGRYVEAVTVDKPGLSIVAAAPPSGTTPSVVLLSGDGPALVDRADTFWSGVGFVGLSGLQDTARLENSDARFERCAFAAASGRGADVGRILIRIHGGKPTFFACAFTGAGGGRIGVRVADAPPAPPVGPAGAPVAVPDAASALARFAYCFFSDLPSGTVALAGDGGRGGAGVWMANCMTARCGPVVAREPGSRGPAEVVNSVLFLVDGGLVGLSPKDAPPIRLSHCLYAPSPGSYLGFKIEDWRMAGPADGDDDSDLSVEPLDRQPGVETVACRSGSPRFVAGRHPARINFGIDDARHGPVVAALAGLAERHGFRVTWAINTFSAIEDNWNTARDLQRRGHEVASHTVSHSPMIGRDPIRVGYAPPGAGRVTLSVARDPAHAVPGGKRLAIAVDGRETVVVPLPGGRVETMAELARALTAVGVAAAPATGMRDVPAQYLADVEGLDIRLGGAHAPLELDQDAYLEYELRASREVVAARTGRPCDVLIYPYSSFTPRVRDAVVRSGYAYARGGVGRAYPRRAVDGSRYHVNGYTLLELREVDCLSRWQDMVEILLDDVRDSGAPLAFFSHGEDEFTLAQWEELFGLVLRRPDTVNGSIEELGRFIVQEQERAGLGHPDEFAPAPDSPVAAARRAVPPMEEELTIYRPAADSPLLGAGIAVGLVADFAGTPLPADRPPNIGLFQ